MHQRMNANCIFCYPSTKKQVQTLENTVRSVLFLTTVSKKQQTELYCLSITLSPWKHAPFETNVAHLRAITQHALLSDPHGRNPNKCSAWISLAVYHYRFWHNQSFINWMEAEPKPDRQKVTATWRIREKTGGRKPTNKCGTSLWGWAACQRKVSWEGRWLHVTRYKGMLFNGVSNKSATGSRGWFTRLDMSILSEVM